MLRRPTFWRGAPTWFRSARLGACALGTSTCVLGLGLGWLLWRPGEVAVARAVLAPPLYTVATYDVVDPPAVEDFPRDSARVDDLVDVGRRLFRTQFNVRDGAGRPGATGNRVPTKRSTQHGIPFVRTAGPDAMSCRGCHNQPFDGGGGDFATNVFVGAHLSDPPTASIAPEATSERRTRTIRGAGVLEMLAREMTSDLWSARDLALLRARTESRVVAVDLKTKGVRFGRLKVRPDGTIDGTGVVGVDADLVVKPFGAKGVVVSLRAFTVNALNQHHGIQATERFGVDATGALDFDQDGVPNEFSVDQVTALTLFQATLAPPEPAPVVNAQAELGRQVFLRLGCAECHVPQLILERHEFVEPSPYNQRGTVAPVVPTVRAALPVGGAVRMAPNGSLLVAAYTDLKRHRISDESDAHFGNELMPQEGVPPDQFLTTPLWGAASHAPYGHRGDCGTLSEAILHHAGEAKFARDGFAQAPWVERAALVAFLRTLGP